MRYITISESTGGEFGWKETYPDGYVYESTFSQSVEEITNAIAELLTERTKFTITFE